MERQLENKISREYRIDKDKACKIAKNIISEVPKELLVNVNEWIKGQKLSDIYIEGYSLPMILALWNNSDFLTAINVMCELTRNKESAEKKIWRMWR